MFILQFLFLIFIKIIFINNNVALNIDLFKDFVYKFLNHKLIQ